MSPTAWHQQRRPYPCRYCGALIAPPPIRPGRRREFCATPCRQAWHAAQQLAQRWEAERRAFVEAWLHQSAGLVLWVPPDELVSALAVGIRRDPELVRELEASRRGLAASDVELVIAYLRRAA